ncbi:phage late control D family protein [uncultured Thiodictyon sp.]|jgi:phage protein D|uniref:phage late control D family protein n=1 Tax=uncultured Thiodictyon sp. TaxID=1846217 RepID=UPI0025E89853|nr:contractile injection system protein, VgrG/Pvc8 family [uncultured Thiodictyon sp.]
MTESLFTATVPVFKVDGQVHGELARDLLRLEIAEDSTGLKTCSARFIAQGPIPGGEDEGLLYLDGKVLDFGKGLEVSIGPASNDRTVFTGSVSAIEACFREEGEPQVLVLAEDRLMDLRMTRRMKTYEEQSDADIARAIAAEHGIPVQAQAQGPTYDRVQQWNQSDLAFLRERARLIRAEVWIADGTLHFKTRDQRTGTELTLVRGNRLLSLDARADLAHQRTKVKVSGYDAAARDAIDEEATGDAIQAEIAGGRTGPEILAQAFGERVSYRVREAPLKSAEATDWARAELLRRARGFVQVRGVTDGAADLIVGSRVRLERVGNPFEGGGYYVTQVCHTYDLTDGFRTRFAAERPTVGNAAARP